jgi:PPE-repeat protein
MSTLTRREADHVAPTKEKQHMDYAFLPPEVNSARMYTGPGSGALLAAAGSWDSLSAELSTTAEGYETTLSQLTGLEWRGAASEAMAATAAHYVHWLQTTAEQTKHTAMQARAAAAAYEHARAMTVPPAAVTANRTRLARLLATNLVGQNTAAIAATEAQYSDYWAQDSAAMSGYAASSTAATTQLPSFNSPNQTATPDAQTAQSNAVTQAVSNATATAPVAQAVSAVGASSTLPANGIIPEDFTALDGIVASFGAINSTYNLEAFATGIIGAENNLGILPSLGAAAAAPAEIAPALASAPLAASGVGGAGLGDISATLTSAGKVGPMSVPASWSAPVTNHISAFEPLGMTTIPGTEEATAAGYPGYPGMPAGATSRAAGAPPRYGIRPTVIARPPAAG